jgi:hypothetical protein
MKPRHTAALELVGWYSIEIHACFQRASEKSERPSSSPFRERPFDGRAIPLSCVSLMSFPFSRLIQLYCGSEDLLGGSQNLMRLLNGSVTLMTMPQSSSSMPGFM